MPIIYIKCFVLYIYIYFLVLNIIATITLSLVLKSDVMNVTALSAQTCPGLALTLTLSLLKRVLGWDLWSLLAQMFPVKWLMTLVFPWTACLFGLSSSVREGL